MMNDLEAIQSRNSRRNYLEIPIESEKLSEIINLIEEINDESGLTIKFVENGEEVFNSFLKSYGMFNGVRSLVILKGPKTDANLKEKAGYYGERIILEAVKLGLGTCFVGGTFDKKRPELEIEDSDELVAVITVGYCPYNRSKKEDVFFKMMHKKTKSIDELLKSDVPLPEWLKSGMESVQMAPSALNTQKVNFKYENGVLKAFVNSEALFNLVDLGVAKLHFEIAAGGKFELGNNAKFIKE